MPHDLVDGDNVRYPSFTNFAIIDGQFITFLLEDTLIFCRHPVFCEAVFDLYRHHPVTEHQVYGVTGLQAKHSTLLGMAWAVTGVLCFGVPSGREISFVEVAHLEYTWGDAASDDVHDFLMAGCLWREGYLLFRGLGFGAQKVSIQIEGGFMNNLMCTEERVSFSLRCMNWLTVVVSFIHEGYFMWSSLSISCVIVFLIAFPKRLFMWYKLHDWNTFLILCVEMYFEGWFS